ncbi:YopX family protein [Bacillus sp. UMB0728]|uniref:YopX family protein n=1 Tax=Bacillus sp. UMB0728 TaxID=2066052 RepID=UPI000C76347F|nr:YopX family protein [Bacillus sp. UMB0728]PLR72184.1 hypothetical protein CYJ37_11550 [Bacillus sp. UMB0728]
MKEDTGVKDLNGKPVLEGDVLADKVPSKGIVIFSEDQFVVTSDFDGRDIRQVSHSDLLNENLILDNNMYVIGNIHDKPDLV